MPAGSLSAVRMGPRAFLRHPRTCKGPYRGRFRSDKHAAVLRLQRTQPKDRRAYDAPYRNPCMSGDGGGKHGDPYGRQTRNRRA